MSAHQVLIDALLCLLVASCWIGVLGMLRMPHPVQALHYLALPATVGVGALTIAVFFQTGFGSASMKMLLVAVVIVAFNSVVTHATARAFRARELGHWEPRDGDPMEFVPSTHHPAAYGADPHGSVKESQS
jgi:multisubunit Na+/H+ antiporter MnhG subunit